MYLTPNLDGRVKSERRVTCGECGKCIRNISRESRKQPQRTHSIQSVLRLLYLGSDNYVTLCCRSSTCDCLPHPGGDQGLGGVRRWSVAFTGCGPWRTPSQTLPGTAQEFQGPPCCGPAQREPSLPDVSSLCIVNWKRCIVPSAFRNTRAMCKSVLPFYLGVKRDILPWH